MHHSVCALNLGLLMIAASVAARPGIGIRLHQPPRGREGVEALWWVDVFNRTGDPLPDRWFEGEVREEQAGRVFWANTHRFEVPTGRKTYRLGDVRIENQDYRPGYEVYFYRTGSVPEGVYWYRVLLMPDNIGDSFRVVVRHPGAPRLVSPTDGTVLPPATSSPVFVWTGPMPAPPRALLHYWLKIVEVQRCQTREEAMRANPAWFETRDVRTTSFRYPVSAPPLDTGRRFAWQVVAMAARDDIGASEVWEFGFEAEGEDTVAALPYSWDVETRRTLRYGLTVTEEQDGEEVGEMTTNVELEFLSSGSVRLTFSALEGSAGTGEGKRGFGSSGFDPGRQYSGVRMEQGRVDVDADWNEHVSGYTMEPTGELLGDDVAGLFLSYYSFDILPTESLAVGDSWLRTHVLSGTRGGILRGGGARLKWSQDKGTAVGMMFALGHADEESLAIRFSCVCSLPAETDFDELALRQVALAGAGTAVFNTVDRCTERSEYVVVPGDGSLAGLEDMAAFDRVRAAALGRSKDRLWGTRGPGSGRVLHALLERRHGDEEGGGND